MNDPIRIVLLLLYITLIILSSMRIGYMIDQKSVIIHYQNNSQSSYNQGFFDGQREKIKSMDFKVGLSGSLAQETYNAGFQSGFKNAQMVYIGNPDMQPFYSHPYPGEYIFHNAISNCGDITLSECKVIKQ